MKGRDVAERVVVVGGGQAGASVAAKLRSEGYAGEIVLIGSEPVPPYQRPPLSKAYLLGDMPLERLFLRPEAFYAEARIDLRLGAAVSGIDADRQEVRLGNETIAYSDLVLATGAKPRWLTAAQGGDLDRVFPVRDLADIHRLAPEVREGKRVLIVGGGYIGLEAAAVCAKRGLQVSVIEAGERILSRVACAETSDYFRQLHEKHGVDIREGTGLVRLVGETAVSAAELSDGSTLPVDLAIVGIGVEPVADLAVAAGLEVANGIKVDTYGRTSNSNIWAAGDCTSLPYRGERIRLESVQNAIDQAEVVARNILGQQVEYVPKPWFWSDQYDVKLQIAGLALRYDDVVVRESSRGQSHWYFDKGTLLAVDAMNDPRAYMIGKRLVEAEARPEKSTIADANAELKTLLRA